MSIMNSINKTITIDGKTFSQNTSVVANASIRRDHSLSAAKNGTLSTRVDSDTGTLTMDAGHGFLTGQKLDVYWSQGSRRNMTVGTVSGDSVPIDGGTGDALPAQGTSITAMVPLVTEMRFDGDDTVVLVGTAEAKSTIVFTGDDDIEDHAILILEPFQVVEWYSGSGETNPLLGDVVTKVRMSHGDSSGSKSVRVSVATN